MVLFFSYRERKGATALNAVYDYRFEQQVEKKRVKRDGSSFPDFEQVSLL